jgi:Phosphotransferase enzyme family
MTALAVDRSIDFGVPGARVTVLRRIDGPFSAVQRVKVETPARTTHAYVKILKPKRPGNEELGRIDRILKREYLATRSLYQALRESDTMSAVRPIAWLPEHRALVTEEVPGRPLADLLVGGKRPIDELVAVARNVGTWIRLYQSIEPTDGVVDLAQRRVYVEDRLKLLGGRVLTADDHRGALNNFDQLASEIGSRTIPAVAIHADLTPHNIIVDDQGRMTVLDFTMARTGTAYHDLSHVYFHFAIMGARHPRRLEMFRTLRRELLSGYSPALTDDDPLFRLMLLQHGVCHVALLAERRVPIVDAAYCWFMRRRWRLCERIAAEVSTPVAA